MPFSAAAIVVSEEERQELQQIVSSRSLPAGNVMRARMMLLLSEGVPYRRSRRCWIPRLRLSRVGRSDFARMVWQGWCKSGPEAVRTNTQAASSDIGRAQE